MSVPASHTLALAGFRLTVLERKFPGHHDDWDGNWLLVEGQCTDKGVTASAKGPSVRTDEIARLADALEHLLDVSVREQRVDFMEPELALHFERDPAGKIALGVSINSDRFAFDLDASGIATAIRDCRAILDACPIRGSA